MGWPGNRSLLSRISRRLTAALAMIGLSACSGSTNSLDGGVLPADAAANIDSGSSGVDSSIRDIGDTGSPARDAAPADAFFGGDALPRFDASPFTDGGPSTRDSGPMDIGPGQCQIQVQVDQQFSNFSGAGGGILDSTQGRFIVLGQSRNLTPDYPDIMALSLRAPGDWAPIHPTGAHSSATDGFSVIEDPDNHRMILYGGFDISGVPQDEVWALPLSGNPVASVLTPGGTHPPARGRHVAIYDTQQKRMIIFGGTSNMRDLSDIWALGLGAGRFEWTQLTALGGPPALRYLGRALYDRFNLRMLVFGISSEMGAPRVIWSLSLNTAPPTWSQLSVQVPDSVDISFIGAVDTFRGRAYFIGSQYPLFQVWRLVLIPPNPPTFTMISATDIRSNLSSGAPAVFDQATSQILIYNTRTFAGLRNETWTLPAGTCP